jgi:hypothetical protein
MPPREIIAVYSGNRTEYIIYEKMGDFIVRNGGTYSKHFPAVQ